MLVDGQVEVESGNIRIPAATGQNLVPLVFESAPAAPAEDTVLSAAGALSNTGGTRF